MSRPTQAAAVRSFQSSRSSQSSRSFRVPQGIPARQIIDDARCFETTVTSIGLAGVSVRAETPALDDVRFVWLEFRLPGEGSDEPETRIRALGELTSRDGGEQCVRFKHLFPDHRRSVERFVQRQEARSRAA